MHFLHHILTTISDGNVEEKQECIYILILYIEYFDVMDVTLLSEDFINSMTNFIDISTSLAQGIIELLYKLLLKCENMPEKEELSSSISSTEILNYLGESETDIDTCHLNMLKILNMEFTEDDGD